MIEEKPSLLIFFRDLHGHIHPNLPFFGYHRYKEDAHPDYEPDEERNCAHKEC